MIDLILPTLAPANLCLIVIGVMWGLVFGMIPGLTATLAVVVLIPLTYGMNSVWGISMLIGIYVGGVSGGLISAVLIGMPGTPSSIVTCFDGFPMAKKGLGEKALGIGITANMVGTLFGWFFLITLAPEIARFALRFGPFEMVAVILFGLTAVIGLSGDSMIKGLIMTMFGLLVSTIGLDPTYAMPRNTFGTEFLMSGISAVPAMIGLFVISQVFIEAENLSVKFIVPKPERVERTFTMQEFKESIPNFIRSGFTGLLIGILPGIGGALSNLVAYDQAKKASKHPETFGTGNIQGIIAPETANNAAIGGALIPMLSLGIPGDAVTAVLLGGLMLHGLAPGPLLIRENPEIVYGVFSSLFLATLAMYFIMMGGRRIFPTLLHIQKSYLLPIVLAAGIVGCYNLQYSLSDVWISIIFGIIGFFLIKHKFPLTPIVITLVLGQMLEENLRLGLLTSNSSILPLFTRPISLVFVLASAASVFLPLIKRMRMKTE
ncbi:MAG: tripartite tricarboxylate transporter permease [Planctomycetes bacterium]|nr:tripartite tricarboxylate transporter permease [Planctomycetota bacterium]